MTSLKNSRGFTLIELLLVISVIALIAAMVFNSLRGARESARISNSLSFQHQVHSLLGADLVGWWNFDNEPVANQFRDISGGGNTGACSAPACPTSVDGVPGTRGTALRFDGVDDHVSVPHSVSLNPVHITMGMWVKFNKIPYTNQIALNKEIQYRLIAGDVDATRVSIRYQTIATGWGWGTFVGNTVLVAGVWYHVVATYDGSKWVLYLNGQPDGSKVESGNLVSTTNALFFGSRMVGSNLFDGLIDDVRIYSRALTASEIQTLYAQTKDKYLVEE